MTFRPEIEPDNTGHALPGPCGHRDCPVCPADRAPDSTQVRPVMRFALFTPAEHDWWLVGSNRMILLAGTIWALGFGLIVADLLVGAFPALVLAR